METFSWQPDLDGARAVHEFQVRTVRLGDGVVQRQPLALRSKKQTWSLKKTCMATEAAAIRAFLDRHEGASPFFWTPPAREKMPFVVSKYTETPKGGGVWVLDFEFEEV